MLFLPNVWLCILQYKSFCFSNRSFCYEISLQVKLYYILVFVLHFSSKYTRSPFHLLVFLSLCLCIFFSLYFSSPFLFFSLKPFLPHPVSLCSCIAISTHHSPPQSISIAGKILPRVLLSEIYKVGREDQAEKTYVQGGNKFL